MAKPKSLKVFRTPIGFHDAYVATPTKKAALDAWGSHRNLFALGEAEEVTERALMRAPLATPGTVVRVSRGTAAEQLQALPRDEVRDAASHERPPAKRRTAARRPKAKPHPSRGVLDKAQEALDRALNARASALQQIDADIAALRRQREAAASRHDRSVRTLETKRDSAQADYEARMARWREN